MEIEQPTGPKPKKNYTQQEAATLGLGWVDPNHAAYGTRGYVGSEGLAPPPQQGTLDRPTQGPAPATPPGPAAPTSMPGPQTAADALTGSATPGAMPPQGRPTTVTSAFQQALLNKLAPGPVDAQNPEIAPAIQANQLAGQRGMERQRALAAERAAAGGYSNSGAFDSQLMGLEQNRAQQEGEFNANAIQGLGDRNAQQLMAALGLGGQMLGQQDALGMQKYGIDTGAGLTKSGQDLQKYGVDTEAALRREGYGLQGDLGNKELGIRDKLGSGQLNLGLLGALLSDKQFGQGLGAQLGMYGAGLNQQALLALLGGL